MKRTLIILIISICCIGFISCSDGQRSEEPQPDIVTSEVTISKAELMDALWNKEVEASPEVRCLLSSSFRMTSETPFTIAKNTTPSDFNSADVVIISSIRINFDDPTIDGRGAECSGDGILQYTVVASEEVPIDIEPATEIKARHSLVHMVSGSHTEYPGCTIRAHFDKAGKVICDPSLIEEEEETVEEEETTPPPEETPPPSDDDDADDDGDDDIQIIHVPPEFLELHEIKAQIVSEDGVPCGTEEIHSVKMVVDDYNCQLQGL